MAEKNETGKTGEHIARSYLERHGLTVLHTNWRFHRYELDLIARTQTELVVVEVKTRSKGYLLSPEEAVDMKKSVGSSQQPTPTCDNSILICLSASTSSV